jgi:hypothetical protein
MAHGRSKLTHCASGFQPFCEIPHCLLKKQAIQSPPKTDTNFPFKVTFLQ